MFPANLITAVLFVKTFNDKINVFGDIRNIVNPNKLNICVNNTIAIKGGMLLNYENSHSVNKLKAAILHKFGDKRSVKHAKKIYPCVLLSNIAKDFMCTDQQLINVE